MEPCELQDVPDGELKQVLSVLFDRLRLKLFREQTPDYVSYEIDESN